MCESVGNFRHGDEHFLSIKAFRKLSLKVHPDKGGEQADFQKLSATNDVWQNLRFNKRCQGRPQRLKADLHLGGDATPNLPFSVTKVPSVLLKSRPSRPGGPARK